MNKIILIIWFVVLVGALSLFAFLASDPRYLLGIEEMQPDAAYANGLKLVRDGKLFEAVETFRKGERFYQRLYDEKGLKRHEAQVVQHRLAIANAYFVLGATDELELAVGMYKKVIEQDPGFSLGQPHLSLGDTLQRLERYSEAIRAYNGVFEYGNGLILLEALYGRGRCYWLTKQPVPASDDWYLFLRYTEKALNDEQWKEIRQLPVCENPRCHFILAKAFENSSDLEKANTHLDIYLQSIPEDRCAHYLDALWKNQPLPADQGKIPIADCFYPTDQVPRPVYQTLLNMYTESSGLYELTLELSGQAEGVDIPEIEIVANGLPVEKIWIKSAQPKPYTISLELQSGKNFIRLTVENLGGFQGTIELHSISIEKK